MIESVSSPKDLYGVTMLDLPWVAHPLSYMHFDESYGRNAKMFEKAKKVASTDLWFAVEYLLDEIDRAFSVNIVSGFSGEWNDDHYCDQYENGGYSGDSFAGQVWFPITKKRYITFHYTM
jgi:hypothetical protein